MSWLGKVAIALPVGLLAVLVVEGWLAANCEYLTDVEYTVDATVGSEGSGVGGEPIMIVFLGDSTAAGVGSPTEAESLAVLVAERIAKELSRAVHVVGHGSSGARTDDVRERQAPALLDAGVDVVVVVVGSNDATHATPVWEMAERTEAMLLTVHRHADAPVVLGGIPQFRTVPALKQPLRWVVGRYAQLLRERQRAAARDVAGTTFVDIAALASPRFLGRPESMSRDGFHPSPVGYGFWADALAPAVVDALRGS